MFLHSSKRLVPVLGTAYRRLAYKELQRRNFWDFPRSSDLRNFVREMEHQMERFDRDLSERLPLRKVVHRFIPIQGTENAPYRMNIDVNGFKPEEIKVSVNNNILKVQAKMERKAEDGSNFYQEVSREITLPDKIVQSELKSYLNFDGVLTIEAPYEPGEKPKEIPVTHSKST